MPLDDRAGAAVTKAAHDRLSHAIRVAHAGRIALVSSFGADSVVLLHMVAQIDPATPVLFLETGMLFPETLAYQRDVAAHLGLKDLRIVRPDDRDLKRADPDGTLHEADPDLCCDLRKTRPLDRALEPFDAWITGRKRFQSETRRQLAFAETDAEGRTKLNPLADWTAQDLAAHMVAHGLPGHPLVAQGYRSIGCAPCTSKVEAGEDPRAGRWRGHDKSECGIHFVNGRAVRMPSHADGAAPMQGPPMMHP